MSHPSEPRLESMTNLVPAVSLPSEIYQCILDSLPFDNPDRIQLLLTCRLVCSHLQAIAELPFLWKGKYNQRWTYHDPAREAERIADCKDDWFKRYLRRSHSDYESYDILVQIATQRKGRQANAQRIHRAYRKDAWDILERYTNLDPPEYADEDSIWLSLSFWAGEMLRAMHRAASLERLYRMRNGQNMELEEGLSTLDGFFGVPYEKLARSLDLMATRCKDSLPTGTENDTRAMCLAILAWMRDQHFGPAEGERYLALQNNFMHKVLESRTSLPLTLVAIFVSIARRLGLDAHPVNFPAHVHACVRVKEHIPEDGEEQEHLSIDVFHSATQPILTAADLDPILHAMGTTVEQHPELLAPASTATMVTRAARNIANSLRQGAMTAMPDTPWRYWTVVTSCYAMVTTITFLSEAHQADHFIDMAVHVKERIRHIFPLDIAVVVESTIMPNLGPLEEQTKQIFQGIIDLTQKAEDSATRVTTRDPKANVKYFVGLVVALSGLGIGQDYMGVVTGWNTDGSYKTHDGTTSSPLNPIYQITFTTTAWTNPQDTQTRYELQTNVRPFRVADSAPDLVPIDGSPKIQTWGLYLVVKSIIWDLGRIFRTPVPTRRGYLWLVPTDELAAEYPDDLNAGKNFAKKLGGDGLLLDSIGSKD